MCLISTPCPNQGTGFVIVAHPVGLRDAPRFLNLCGGYLSKLCFQVEGASTASDTPLELLKRHFFPSEIFWVSSVTPLKTLVFLKLVEDSRAPGASRPLNHCLRLGRPSPAITPKVWRSNFSLAFQEDAE